MEVHRIRTSIIKAGEEIISICPSIHAGNIGPLFYGRVNNAFGLCLVKDSSEDYILIVYMKLQFFFEDNKELIWSLLDKRKFINEFENSISSKWGGERVLKNLSKGKKVSLDFRFLSFFEEWSIGEHWEVYVRKIKVGGFDQSYVNPFMGVVQFDSEDLRFTEKRRGIYQRGALHEFGHMLGLDDEYIAESKHIDDFNSIMNTGEITRIRHDSSYLGWLNQILNEKNIK